MSDEKPPSPYGNSGLVVLVLINIVGAMYMSVLFAGAIAYERNIGSTISVAQAAYIGALWTQVVAYGLGLLAFDVLMLGLAICSRVSALHRAVVWAGKPQRPVQLPPEA